MADIKKPKVDLFGGITTAATNGLEMIGDNVQAASKDWSSASYDDYIKNIEDMQFDGSNASIMEQALTIPEYKSVTARDLGYDGMADDILKHTGKGVSMGAAIGSIIPGLGTAIGAAAGAIIGAGSGWIKGSTDKRRAEAEADSIMENERNAIRGAQNKIVNAVNVNDMKYDSFMKGQVFADGGLLEQFDTGGSHQQNPLGGIPQGIGMDGMPNLVEEGETKYNDYIYSKRIKLTKKMCKEFKLPEKYIGMSMADVSKKIAKDTGYDKAPTDNISKNGFNEMVGRLRDAQEYHKAMEFQRKLEAMSPEERQQLLQTLPQLGNTFAKGGDIHIAPNKKGTFTAAATKHGMGVQEFASHVLAHKDSFSPKMVKKANFAKNATKFHADGGELDKLPQLDYMSILDGLASGKTLADTEPLNPIPKTLTKYDTGTNSKNPWKPDALMYAPIVANAANVLTDAFGITNKVDTRDIENLSIARPRTIGYNPVGKYQEFKPIDQQALLSKIGNQKNATESRIMDMAGGNRATAMANIAASNRGYTESIGDLALKIAEANNKERNAVIAANNTIDMANAKNAMAVDQYNANAINHYNEADANLDLRKLAMIEDLYEKAGMAKNTNKNNLVGDLSKLGRYLSDVGLIDSNEYYKYLVNGLMKGDN